tara:strand:- start:5674 stop:6261 length:588 start_codon:yes stop_codon:yes gene_type:complete
MNTTYLCDLCKYRPFISRENQHSCDYKQSLKRHLESKKHLRNIEISKNNNLSNKYTMEVSSEANELDRFPVKCVIEDSSDESEEEEEDIASLPSVVKLDSNPQHEMDDDNLPLETRRERYKDRHEACREYSFKWAKTPFRERCPSYFEEDENGKLEPLYPRDLVRCYENGWYDKNDRYGSVLCLLLERVGIRIYE